MATPPFSAIDVVPWSGPVPLASAAVTDRGVVARLEVAVLVLLVDDRLGRERRAGRRRRRRRLRDQTSWLAAAGLTTIGTLASEVSPPPVNCSVIVSAVSSDEVR